MPVRCLPEHRTPIYVRVRPRVTLAPPGERRGRSVMAGWGENTSLWPAALFCKRAPPYHRMPHVTAQVSASAASIMFTGVDLGC